MIIRKDNLMLTYKLPTMDCGLVRFLPLPQDGREEAFMREAPYPGMPALPAPWAWLAGKLREK